MPRVPFEKSFDATVGLEYQRIEEAEVVATISVREELLGLFDLLHGGVLAAAAEAMASIGTFSGVGGQGNAALGMSVSCSVLREVREGERLELVATRLAAEPDVWTWQVHGHTDGGELCATATVSVAVRPMPASIG